MQRVGGWGIFSVGGHACNNADPLSPRGGLPLVEFSLALLPMCWLRIKSYPGVGGPLAKPQVLACAPRAPRGRAKEGKGGGAGVGLTMRPTECRRSSKLHTQSATWRCSTVVTSGEVGQRGCLCVVCPPPHAPMPPFAHVPTCVMRFTRRASTTPTYIRTNVFSCQGKRRNQLRRHTDRGGQRPSYRHQAARPLQGRFAQSEEPRLALQKTRVYHTHVLLNPTYPLAYPLLMHPITHRSGQPASQPRRRLGLTES